MNRHPILKEIYIVTGAAGDSYIAAIPFAGLLKAAYVIADDYPDGGDAGTLRIKKMTTGGVETNMTDELDLAGKVAHAKESFTISAATIVANDRIKLTQAGADIAELTEAIIAIEVG